MLPEPEPEVADRLRALLNLVRCPSAGGGGALVLVGRSILFRTLCARLLAAAPPAPADPAAAGGGGAGAAEVQRNRPGLAEQVRRGRKLGNGAVMAVTVVFPAAGGGAGGGGGAVHGRRGRGLRRLRRRVTRGWAAAHARMHARERERRAAAAEGRWRRRL